MKSVHTFFSGRETAINVSVATPIASVIIECTIVCNSIKWNTVFVLPKVTSNCYHVLNNSASRREDQTINLEYFVANIITRTDDVREK